MPSHGLSGGKAIEPILWHRQLAFAAYLGETAQMLQHEGASGNLRSVGIPDQLDAGFPIC